MERLISFEFMERLIACTTDRWKFFKGASLLGAQHKGDRVEKELASLHSVRLEKALEEISSLLHGRQVVDQRVKTSWWLNPTQN